jgi:hypothetical protein
MSESSLNFWEELEDAEMQAYRVKHRELKLGEIATQSEIDIFFLENLTKSDEE